jgi:formylglycine-generating enzyme required for sulfatase activity
MRIRRERDGMTMVLVPSGKFRMGALPSDSDAYSDETPRHWVALPEQYYVDECHVTVAMWRIYSSQVNLMMPTLRPEAGESHPMHHISWSESLSYAHWAGVDLLTEEQWERAARGGLDGQIYPWGGSDDIKLRNGKGDLDGFDHLAPVKSYPPNPYGLYDVVGNVETWCADRFESYEGRTSKDRIPSPTPTAQLMAVRGGAFSGESRNFRVSRRNDVPATIRNGSIGVRCGKSVP